MYETLVKRLRNKGCQICPICREAADAIEDMSREVDMDSDAMTAMDAAMPRWISVMERLPEEPYGCLLIVWDSPYDGGDDFLNYLPYFAGWDGEQWNDGDGQRVPFEVAFWMPLPELPKEET